jgi:hypothetical protein
MNAEYFAALSISSLALDDRSVSIDENGSYISQSAIYQQLSHIEDITSNFIVRKPIKLDYKHAQYAEIDYDNHQDFELHVTSFSQQDVISITIKCMPNFTLGEPLSLCSDKKLLPGVDHCALVFNLERKVGTRSVGERVPCKATLLNGEYCIVLMNASIIVPGTYLLSVGLADVGYYAKNEHNLYADIHAIQAVRVHCSKSTAVRTVPLEAGVTVTGRASYAEMCQYRFVAGDHHQMVSITAVPVNASGSGAHSDPDLYVTNRFNGQVAVSKHNYVWSNVNLGVSRIDILPTDPHLPSDTKEGRIFVIGVISNGPDDAEFALTVTCSYPPPCTTFNFCPRHVDQSMAPPAFMPAARSSSGVVEATNGAVEHRVLNCAERGCTLDLAVGEGEYLHFAVQLPEYDSSAAVGGASTIVVLVHDAPGLASIAHATVVQQCSVSDLVRSEDVNVHSGSGVHAGDTLAAHGVLSGSSVQGLSDRSGCGIANKAVSAVLYASADVRYPTSECYTWRVSSSSPYC